ncbi:SDR family oxidoreductase [Mucilaginibacter sp.]|uniref:SDR family oxidoreductase n=1 Tax=Mucilaginibacter sp. TaxID=1882438 RepID=UPI00261DAB0D|nr:SDR family oxidoreductase [Mucilaginibacter sp.]MDB4920515.1 family oxidoreductase [Mucilaginibacter sp.]
MKTIFITGASSGLGKAAVELFATKGWKVIATMRAPGKQQELGGIPNVTLLPLDVTDPKQITTTVEKAVALGKIDVVFNNAGYGLMGPLEAISDAQIGRQLDTNLLGVIRVIQAFIPHFRESGGGLFITTTSIGGHVAFPFSTLYHASKWALEGFSESLSFELRPFGISVKTVAPGGIATDFAGRSLDLAKHEAYQGAFDHMVTTAFKDADSLFSSAGEIAEVVYAAAIDGEDRVHYVAGPDANALYARRTEIGAEAARREIGQTFLG